MGAKKVIIVTNIPNPYRIPLFNEVHAQLLQKGVELKVVGVVASANHRISKAGKPFGSFIIEDYSGFIDIPLFGENYLNYKKYLETGYYLYIKGRVENRWGKEDDFEFKISSIEMLTDVREKYIKNISIEVDLEPIVLAQITQLVNQIVIAIETITGDTIDPSLIN